ncbi:MAG: response regulator [Oscillospiraceae bacterium]
MEKKVVFENDYYVIDDNFRLVAFNKSVEDRYTGIKVGDLCYKATMFRDSPCMHCPIAGNTDSDSPIYFDPVYNDWVEALFSEIGEGKYSVTCRRAGNGGSNTAVNMSVSQITPESSGKAVNDKIAEQFREQLKIINGLNSIFFSISLIDLEKDSFRMVTTIKEIEQTIGCECSAKTAISRVIEDFVLPESKEAMRQFSNLSTLDIRMRDKNILTLDYLGKTVGWARAILIPVEYSEIGEVTQVLYCLREISGEKKNELLQQAALEERMTVIRGLAAEYFSVMIVDFEKDSVRVYRESDDIDWEIGGFFNKFSTWSEGIKAYSEQFVDEKDRAKFHRLLSLENLRSSTSDFSANYLRVTPNGDMHIQFKVAYETDKNGNRFAVIGSKNIEEEFRNQLILRDAQHEIARSYSIIEGLSHEYHTVWYITTSDRTMHLYRYTGNSMISDSLRAKIKSIDYTTCMNRYVDLYVDENDRERVREACDFDKLADNVRENGIYTINFLKTGGYAPDTYNQMVFTRTKDEFDDVNFVLAFRDIDTLVREEQEKQRILRGALATAEHANRAKTTFLNNMSHDIRTPMNAIIGFTSLAATHIDNTEQVQDYLRKIQVSSNHLLSLINDVLDMSRIESGKVKIEERETHLPEVLHDLRTIVQSDIISKQLDFYIDTVDVTNEDVICDKLRLNQVLMNILSNAIKFTKYGGVVSLRLIQKPCSQSGYARYEFRVKDTGIGMSHEFISHVFEPFERESTSTVSGIQGTGLGMAITKNIVDMMGGTISVESEVGKGSEFIVDLQFRICGQSVKIDVIPELQGLRALVADDDVNSCMSVCKMLSAIGMRSEWTSRGKEAVIRAKFAIEQDDEFNAYIIDWLMPDMNGVEVVRQIRRIIGDSKPIIILTAYDWSDIEEEAINAGVTAFCSKPIFMSELKEILSNPTKHCEKSKLGKSNPESFKGKKILLVEDNELNQEIAVGILTEAGFNLDVANDGSVALDKMKDFQSGQYDLILMDIQMPIMDGYETTRQIRLLPNEAAATIPIIAMTANAFNEDRENAYSCGMNGFISKPIEVTKLVEMLSLVLATDN